MTTTLTQTHKDQLSKWIDPSISHEFTLLYKISLDGCNGQTFHGNCDNNGPTVTVLYNTNNSVYGGYTAANWNSNGSFITDPQAFLFKLMNNGSPLPKKFLNKTGGTNAIYGNASYGPVFGGGHDLCCFSGTVNRSGNYFRLNGSASLGNTYDMQGQNYYTLMDGHLQVLDLEVYSVREKTLVEKANQMPTKPWMRNIDWSSSFEEVLKDKVATYKPLPGLDLQQAKILLVGQIGAGKSSYFNTINSIFRGHISAQASAGSADHSLTKSYRMYQVRDGYLGKPLNFRLCDNRGLEVDHSLTSIEVGYLLDGHVPEKYKFTRDAPLAPDTIGFVKNPTLSDSIHCVAFVLDASSVDVFPVKVMKNIKLTQTHVNQRGIPQVVLLTNIDRICEHVSVDVRNLFFSAAVEECVKKVSMMIGLPQSHVLPVKNYHCEVQLDQNINILALLSLTRILNFVDDVLYNKLDDREVEKVGRIKISE